tara:strand:- start:786 stop:1808 length:1023 start_codon:yes stop_codon:yes gene_type:complete
MKKYFTFLISFLILSSCNKECKKSDELEFINGKYYCGKKLFSGYITNLNPPRQNLSNQTFQSINSKEQYKNGNLIFREVKGIDGWKDFIEYNYYDDVNTDHTSISNKLYKEKVKKNFTKAYFSFVSPYWLETGIYYNFSLKSNNGQLSISNFPILTENGMDYYNAEINETSLNQATSPYGTEKSLVGSLKSSEMHFKDSIVKRKVKYYENRYVEGLFGPYVEVFKEYNGQVKLNQDYSMNVQMGWLENVDPEKFITLEYDVIRNDEDTILNDSINNTFTITYSNITCRNKILHKCLVLQGDNLNDINIKHRNPVTRDFYKKINRNFTFVTPLGQDVDFSN